MIFYCLFILGLWSVLLGLHRVANSDLFWQIKTGQLIWDTSQIPHTDPFTYTVFGKEWINLEWLSCLVFYGVFSWGGFAGLSFLSGLLVLILALLLFWLFYGCTKQDFLSFILVILVLYLCGNRLQILRPDLFAFILFVLYLGLLFHDSPRLWKMIILMVLQIMWSNLHSSALVGCGLVCLWWIGKLYEFTKNKESAKKIVWYGLWVMAVLGVALINPFTFQVFTYPLAHLSAPVTMAYVSDWFPSLRKENIYFFHIWFFIILIFLTMIQFFKNFCRINISLFLIALYFTYLAIQHQRFVFYAGTLLVLLNLFLLPQEKLQQFSRKIYQYRMAFIVVLMLLPVFWMRNGWMQGIRFESSPFRALFILGRPVGIGFDEEAYPQKAVDYLLNNPPQHRLYNSMDIGGYLIFRLWPRDRVFIDTRTPVYGEEFLHHVMGMANRPEELSKVFDKLMIDTLILSREHIIQNIPLMEWLARSTEWQPVFESPQADVYRREIK